MKYEVKRVHVASAGFVCISIGAFILNVIAGLVVFGLGLIILASEY